MTATITLNRKTAEALMSYMGTSDLSIAIETAVNGRLNLLGYEFPELMDHPISDLPSPSKKERAEAADDAVRGIKAAIPGLE